DARSLSLASRATLAQSVILAIPIVARKWLWLARKMSAKLKIVEPLQMYGFLFVRICFGQCDMGKVSDVGRISGYQLLEVIIRKITGVPPPHLAAGTNRIIWGGPQRVRFFIWLEHSSVCGVCGDISEDILHAIRDCNATGTVRNRNGKWIFGFNRFLGSYSVFEAELWGILD
ncbi:hypothetical protein Goshw_009528, partial [Gossypium schwendimanii]|nr:hypothetical protein [Gossypium schwendimanii]